jgi:hypothetical protein
MPFDVSDDTSLTPYQIELASCRLLAREQAKGSMGVLLVLGREIEARMNTTMTSQDLKCRLEG